MELSPICKKEYPALRALYRSAFPAAERMPLPRFFALQKKGQAEILVLRTGGAFAGLMIVVLVIAINFIGDALRDALDPNSGK